MVLWSALCSRVCASDPTSHWNEDLDCGRRDGHAPRLRWTQRPGADRIAATALLRTRVHISRAQRRYRKTAVVGWRRSVSVCQAAGTRPIHLAEGREWHRATESRAAFDAARRH